VNIRLIFGILILQFQVFSSNGDGSIGPRSSALGHASSCLADVWSVRNNQGNLGFIDKSEAGAFYENRFFVKELTQTGFSSVFTTNNKGTFGFAYTALGYKLYKESQLTFGYGLKLTETISVGIGLDYLNTKIADIYGKANAFTGSIGITAKILPQVYISTHVFNPFRAKITNYNNETIPTIFKFGVKYVFSDKVFLVSEAEKLSSQKINLKAGIEYNPSSIFFLRAGCSSNPTQASFGIGANYNGLKIDMSTSYHSILGISPQIGLSFGFGKNKTNLKSKKSIDKEKP
jgi:hypothetical protein